MDAFAQQQQRQGSWLSTTATTSQPSVNSADQQQVYSPFYQDNSRTPLSLNIASLTVTSPTTLSPINPTSAVLSPVTPMSPPFQHQALQQQSPFSFDPPSGQQSPAGTRHYDEHGILGSATAQFEMKRTTPQSSRPPSNAGIAAAGGPSAAVAQLPRKRSFTAHPNLSSASISSGGGASTSAANGSSSASSSTSAAGVVNGSSLNGTSKGVGLGLSSVVNVNIGTPLVEVDAEHEAEDSGMYDDDAMELASAGGNTTGGGGSPVDGSTSGQEEAFGMGGVGGASGGMGGSMGIIGKPMATNNFVTKLYQ